MTFRVTGKESLMGGPAPEDRRHEQWIKKESALFESAGRSDTSRHDARREQRVRQEFQSRADASNRAKQRELLGLQQLRLEGRILDHWR